MKADSGRPVLALGTVFLPRKMCHPSAFPDLDQGSRLGSGTVEFEPALTCVAGATGGSLVCYSTVLAAETVTLKSENRLSYKNCG